MKKQIINSIILILFFILWCTYTLSNYKMQCFYVDEIWAWAIAKDINFIDIIKLMHYEGHTFLWYMVLKPFTHFDGCFPFAMKYINWIFVFASLIIFWVFAPMNNLIKFLFTISAPMLCLYPLLARPYGLGILLLFILTVLYKHRLKYPIIYATTIFFAANTNLFAAVVVVAMSFIFFFDVIKERKSLGNYKTISSVCILLITFLSLGLQWIPMNMPDYEQKISFATKILGLKTFFVIPEMNNILKYISLFIYIPGLIAVCILNFKVFIKRPRWIFFTFFVYFFYLFVFLFVYCVGFHHGYHMYIVLIMTYWFLLDDNKDFNNYKPAKYSLTVFIIAISLLLLPTKTRITAANHWTFITFYDYMKIISDIEKVVPQGSTIYCAGLQDLYIFLENKYNLADSLGNKIPSYEAYKNYYQKIAGPNDIVVENNKKQYYMCSWIHDCPEGKNCYRIKNNFTIIDISK